VLDDQFLVLQLGFVVARFQRGAANIDGLGQGDGEGLRAGECHSGQQREKYGSLPHYRLLSSIRKMQGTVAADHREISAICQEFLKYFSRMQPAICTPRA
jgi:hypothetical protein